MSGWLHKGCLGLRYINRILINISVVFVWQTTGAELLMKCVNIPETNDSVELYIIDSAGKQTLVEACEKMWGELSLLCLVFDLTSEQSFANCSHWIERVHAHCQGFHIPGTSL
ncbi:intraflagellar transport protein 27 homolog [Micropterus dolomieu]|uniref:intraflagellar transport protein 27 homolog n=1 Tax=Micropterus dolomieu TaxID=147949 RepID=UPI001E8CF02F|nr:intraflagellar transport protein 27 homolog [Micropterus dolomieu]